MKILVYGTGGVGGYYGISLEEAGHDVTFLARGKHLETMQKDGLKLKSIDGDYTIDKPIVTDNVDSLSSDFDLILLGVKSWQVTEAVKVIKPILNDKTVILPLQNGVNNIEDLLEIIDSKHVLAGFCKIYAKIEGYGVINHFGHPPELQFGELDNTLSERVKWMKSEFEKARFKTTVPKDIIANIWKKFMFICTVSGLGALTRVSIGRMYEHEATRKLLQVEVQEIYDIALAKGVNFPEDMVEQTMKFISKQPYESTASTQRDIMAGRPSELDNFNGYIVRAGKQLGIATPTHEFVYSCLLPLEQIARN